MKLLAFGTMKGGTGKTTTCFNIACTVAKEKKVLIIDCDPQCNISVNLGFNAYDRAQNSIATIFENPSIDPTEVFIPNPIAELPNLDLIPSSLYLYETELKLIITAGKEVILRKYIQKHLSFFEYYDYIFFDTNPSMGLANQNAFVACSDICLICDPDSNSALGAEFFVELWDKIRTGLENEEPRKLSALLLNNVEKTHIGNDLQNFFDEHDMFSGIVLENKIPHTTRFKEATSEQTPIFSLSVKKKDEESKKKAVASINAVVNELFERGVL